VCSCLRGNQAIWRADKLTQSTLARAFRGELVPTEAELARAEGRSYETAAELLERIHRD
jgi:type I restriction enzyme S subunit